MKLSDGRHNELLGLLEALCENQITPEQLRRLEEIVLVDAESRKLYLQYIDLHGTLYWDAARAIAEESCPLPETIPEFPEPARRSRPRRERRIGYTVLALLLVLAGGLYAFKDALFVGGGNRPGVAELNRGERAAPDRGNRQPQGEPEPIRLKSISPGNAVAKSVPEPSENLPPVAAAEPDRLLPEDTVAFVNERIHEGWNLEGIKPSPVAEDGEWVRRVYLDVVGRIPTAEETTAFLENEDPDKRSALIDKLLQDPDYVRNWTTVWTNLLVGRSSDRDVNRPALQKFLRESFAENRPWNEIVFDLVAAEGSARENGATNFLLAHLNNEAVPATAIVSRLFLGIQVQCTQCHDHPFNDWKQDQFWELNAFFKQTAQQQRTWTDPRTGETLTETLLTNIPQGGETYYENRRGMMQLAFPRFEGVSVSPGPATDRREELARLMTSGRKPQIAEAMVNRMWAHFFGYGFTRPIDDMSPHNPPTHPQLLDGLARAFAEGGYDLKQLIRWICNSQAYQLTSRLAETNLYDDPETGNPPLFSRMYVKPMTAEQLYDSLLVATRADQVGASDWAEVSRKRGQWLQQFVVAFQTEENDEATTFDGTIPQALLMMNSSLVEDALSGEGGSYFQEVVRTSKGDAEALRRLCLSALSREPTGAELQAMRRLLRQRMNRAGANPREARIVALQDVFWAYLNSNEFILNH